MKVSLKCLPALSRGVLAASLCCGAAVSQAALQGRIGGYYDTVLNITWSANANGVAGTAFDDGISATDGFASWSNAQTWVAGVTIQGVGGWRLPTIDTGCSGFNCNAAAGELGYMFYVNLGSTAGSPASSTLFSNLALGNYWSPVTYLLDPDQAGVLDFSSGYSDYDLKVNPYSAAWAVKTGDVLPVPEPGTATMMLAALALLGGRLLRNRA